MVASTLTTIAVFLPLVFVQGIAGQLFRDQALTVAIAIASAVLDELRECATPQPWWRSSSSPY